MLTQTGCGFVLACPRITASWALHATVRRFGTPECPKVAVDILGLQRASNVSDDKSV